LNLLQLDDRSDRATIPLLEATSVPSRVFFMQFHTISSGLSSGRSPAESEIQICLRSTQRNLCGTSHTISTEKAFVRRGGRRWNASTINGNAQRGAGLIFNELYAGRIVWNKVRMVKDPDTGKRLSRPTLVMSGKASTCLNY
jgi:hypothetical protein